MTIHQLLKKLITWFLGQSRQKTETLIIEEHTAPGIRLLKLNRKSQRAVATWKALFYSDRFDVTIGVDTLENVDNASPIERKNKLATHAINVIKIYYDTVVDPDTGVRKIRQEVLVSEECDLRRFADQHNYASAIVDTSVKLLLKPQYHPNQAKFRYVFEQTAKHFLGDSHRVYLEPVEPDKE